MVSPHFPLLQSKHPSSLFLFPTNHTTLIISQLIRHGHGGNYNNSTAKKRRRNMLSSSSPSSCCWSVRAADKDSQQFEVDPEKAKEALEKLDQQLQTLSKKQVSTPKIRASEVKVERDRRVEESPEISGSFLPYLTVALLVFTIFYNVLFYAVIKPWVEGPDSAPQPQPSTQTEFTSAQL